MGLLSGAWFASTVFIFKYHTEINFATWATFSGAIISAYHWLIVRDDKTPDCEHS
jgi:hypothetical protein